MFSDHNGIRDPEQKKNFGEISNIWKLNKTILILNDKWAQQEITKLEN